MKIRVISLFTVFIIAIMLVGCGGKPESMPSKSDSSQATSVKQKNGGIGSGDYLDPKTALTAFVNDYTEMKKPLWELIAEKDSDGKYAMDLLPVPSADLMIGRASSI